MSKQRFVGYETVAESFSHYGNIYFRTEDDNNRESCIKCVGS